MRLDQQLVPELPAAALAALEQHLRRTNVFLEYGAGGSTAYAAELGVKSGPPCAGRTACATSPMHTFDIFNDKAR